MNLYATWQIRVKLINSASEMYPFTERALVVQGHVRQHLALYAYVWQLWYMVAKMDSSDSKYRCIGMIITRDLSLVASRLSRMAVARPHSRVAVTTIKNFLQLYG